LEVPGTAVKKSPASITVRRLDNDGGEVLVDPTPGYAATKHWHRKVTFSGSRLDVVDEVVFPANKPAKALFRWHLGTRDEVTIAGSERRFVVRWKDAEITLESSVPISVATELLPDNTVNLGERVGPDYLHRCILVRTVEPTKAWTLTTGVVGK